MNDSVGLSVRQPTTTNVDQHPCTRAVHPASCRLSDTPGIVNMPGRSTPASGQTAVGKFISSKCAKGTQWTGETYLLCHGTRRLELFTNPHSTSWLLHNSSDTVESTLFYCAIFVTFLLSSASVSLDFVQLYKLPYYAFAIRQCRRRHYAFRCSSATFIRSFVCSSGQILVPWSKVGFISLRMHQKNSPFWAQKSKRFLERRHSSLPRPLLWWGGDTPYLHPIPSAPSVPRSSRLRRSTSRLGAYGASAPGAFIRPFSHTFWIRLWPTVL